MSATKSLSTRPVTKEDIVERANREVIPFIRQLAPGTVVSGSRSVDAIVILTLVLTILDKAGVIKDDTVP